MFWVCFLLKRKSANFVLVFEILNPNFSRSFILAFWAFSLITQCISLLYKKENTSTWWIVSLLYNLETWYLLSKSWKLSRSSHMFRNHTLFSKSSEYIEILFKIVENILYLIKDKDLDNLPLSRNLHLIENLDIIENLGHLSRTLVIYREQLDFIEIFGNLVDFWLPNFKRL